MVILLFSIQEEVPCVYKLKCKSKKRFSILISIVMYLHFSMQEEDIIEHTNGKCHVFTLMINELTITYPKHRPHNIITHTNAKIVGSALLPSVMKLQYWSSCWPLV